MALPHGTVEALLRLFPIARGRTDAPEWLVEQLVEAERHRRGEPDRVTGAYHALALTQGSLLKEEYDLSTHGHDEWTLSAVLVDPVEFTLFNMRHGFQAGDAALRGVVDGLRSRFPTAKVVRIHADGFAVLLGPTAGVALDPGEDLPRAEKAAAEALSRATPDPAATATPRVTCGALTLTVVDPPSWQLLGPLVSAECERALVIVKRSATRHVVRRVVLDGRLPEL